MSSLSETEHDEIANRSIEFAKLYSMGCISFGSLSTESLRGDRGEAGSTNEKRMSTCG